MKAKKWLTIITLVITALSLVASSKMGTLVRLPGITRRKVGMTSNHHAPYVLGYTRATMAGTESSEVVRRSKSPKPVPVRIAGCNSPA